MRFLVTCLLRHCARGLLGPSFFRARRLTLKEGKWTICHNATLPHAVHYDIRALHADGFKSERSDTSARTGI